MIIQKAIKACENSKNSPFDYFSQVGKIVKTGFKDETSCAKIDYYLPDSVSVKLCPGEHHIKDYDYYLSKYACYLIVQNAEPSKNKRDVF